MRAQLFDAAERELGRVAADADVDTLGAMLIGAGRLLFTDRDTPPGAADVHRVVTTAISGALP